jgi:hypothetical protein
MSLTSGGYGMNSVEQNIGRKWTYADYLTWSDEERLELIDGVTYAMSPGPGKLHQLVSFELAR